MIEKILTYFPVYLIILIIVIIFGSLITTIIVYNPLNLLTIVASLCSFIIAVAWIRNLVNFIKRDYKWKD